MKISHVYTKSVGAIADGCMSFEDDWDGNIEEKLLLTGPNGCGKSTLLRGIATLWEAFGSWLDHRKALLQKSPAREWLQRWDGMAVIFAEVGNDSSKLGIVFGSTSWAKSIIESHDEVIWIGETVEHTGLAGKPKRTLLMPNDAMIEVWASERRKMLVSFDKVSFPNMIYLDAEERRWVSPKRNLGEHIADQPSLRWLPKYIPSEDWKGQLEASLMTLKTTNLHRYHEVIRAMNQFLNGKEIVSDIKAGENRMRVKLKDQRGVFHGLDELSAGEHQVLILIYVLMRWAEKGAIVLIDEPDLYLHPSLNSMMLSTIESLVKALNGQLIITSHAADIWERYENHGKRIELNA